MESFLLLLRSFLCLAEFSGLTRRTYVKCEAAKTSSDNKMENQLSLACFFSRRCSHSSWQDCDKLLCAAHSSENHFILKLSQCTEKALSLECLQMISIKITTHIAHLFDSNVWSRHELKTCARASSFDETNETKILKGIWNDRFVGMRPEQRPQWHSNLKRKAKKEEMFVRSCACADRPKIEKDHLDGSERVLSTRYNTSKKTTSEK